MAERRYTDPRTGKTYTLKAENTFDRAAARISLLYLVVALAFLFWLLFDVWASQHSLARGLGYQNVDRLNSPTFRLVAFTFLAGALGGVANGIRSALKWHCDLRAFGGRYAWKYITLPWLGATLALFVFALISSGISVAAGEITPSEAGAKQMLFMFAAGVLSGYGSHDVFLWLDDQVTRIFERAGDSADEDDGVDGDNGADEGDDN